MVRYSTSHVRRPPASAAMFTPIRLSADNASPMTGAGNHTYLLIGANGSAALVDAGGGQPSHLAALSEALGREHAQLDDVFVTHAHADHATGVTALASGHSHARFHKYPWPEEDAKFAVAWMSLAEGDRVSAGDTGLAVLHTPGHSPDHCAFWHEPSATMFTGDLVILGGSVLIPFSRGGDVAQYLASLTRLLALRPARLLPAHGRAIDDPAAALSEAIEHRLARERQVAEALAARHETVPAIVESIYHGLSPALQPAARESVRAHLEKLRREGRAREEDGRWRA